MTHALTITSLFLEMGKWRLRDVNNLSRGTREVWLTGKELCTSFGKMFTNASQLQKLPAVGPWEINTPVP